MEREKRPTGIMEALRISLCDYRDRNRLTQEGLAELLGVSQASVSRLLSGNQPISGDLLDKVAALVGANEYLMAQRLQSLASYLLFSSDSPSEKRVEVRQSIELMLGSLSANLDRIGTIKNEGDERR